jgi:pimeloyl-ACP methyl ester carboxylesterase
VSALIARALGSRLIVEGPAHRVKQVAAGTNLVPRVAYAFGGMCRERTPRAPVDALLKNIGRMQTPALMHLARSYVEHSARSLLSHVRAPTLIVAGERDRLASPAHCERVADALRDAELWVAPGCSHLALVEDPEGVNRRIEGFLGRLEDDGRVTVAR